MAGEQGGGLFVLIYAACVLLVGIPLLMSEIAIGRRGRQNVVDSMGSLATEAGSSRYWQGLGWSMMIGGILILSFYSVIAGWAFAYVFRVGSGMFVDADAALSKQIFAELVSDPERLMAWHTIFMAMTMAVVAQGVRAGLERAVRILMPCLFILLLILVGYAMSTDHFLHGARYLFHLDLARLQQKESLQGIVLSAVGHAFFTLSLGMGAIMIYGSYLSDRVSIVRVACIITLIDLAVALLAGLAIFPIVFAFGLEPGSGPGLLFETLPLAFGQMPLGSFFGLLFFVLVLIAAWSSAISLLEPTVNLFMEKTNAFRLKSTVIVGGITWLLGILTVLSFNLWAFDFNFIGQSRSNGIFDILDILTTNAMLPVHGVLLALFTGWSMKRAHIREEIGLHSPVLFNLWLFTVRYVAPVGVFLVFLHSLGFTMSG